MTRARIIRLLTPILIAAILFAAEGPADSRAVRTAVFDFAAENYLAADVRTLSQRLRTELSTFEQFSVLQRLDLHQLRSAAECRTTACIARVGRALEAERAVSGRVERTVDDDLENFLQKEIPDLARELAGIRRKKSNATLWLFLAGGAGTPAYLFTRDDGGNGSADENGSAEIIGTFPPPR